LTHYRAFYSWFLRTANDPSAYQQLLDIAWKLTLVFLCAFAAEWLVFRLIKRPVALLEARLPQAAQQRRRLSLARTWQSLVRLPFVLGRLVLELLPVLAFIGIATMLLGTGIGDLATNRLVILAGVNAYALS